MFYFFFRFKTVPLPHGRKKLILRYHCLIIITKLDENNLINEWSCFTIILISKCSSTFFLSVHTTYSILIVYSVTDNNFPPEFESSTVNERIPETIKFGVIIANVTAVDRDDEFPNNDIRFRLFASLSASEYFGMDSLTGNIYVKKDLTLDTTGMYQVSMIFKMLGVFFYRIIWIYIINWNKNAVVIYGS